MCSVWWPASGFWSFCQYLSPLFFLLYSSLYSASWPLQRLLFESSEIQKCETALTSQYKNPFLVFWSFLSFGIFFIFHFVLLSFFLLKWQWLSHWRPRVCIELAGARATKKHVLIFCASAGEPLLHEILLHALHWGTDGRHCRLSQEPHVNN